MPLSELAILHPMIKITRALKCRTLGGIVHYKSCRGSYLFIEQLLFSMQGLLASFTGSPACLVLSVLYAKLARF